MTRYNTDSISAQNTFSTPITLQRGGILTLTGTWSATVTVQRYDVGSGAWVDVTNNSGTAFTATANGTYTISPFDMAANYRWGIKTGAYTSGIAVGTIQGS